VQEHINIKEMEDEMTAMVTSATMFEVVVPEYKQLKACRRELIMIKNVWDHITIIQTTFANWKNTPWRQINIEQMDQECKKFSKELRVLDKETRAWDAYAGAENNVKNMMTSLRAVGELQNPSIRDRHWTQLMQATGVSQLCTHHAFKYLLTSRFARLDPVLVVPSCEQVSNKTLVTHIHCVPKNM